MTSLRTALKCVAEDAHCAWSLHHSRCKTSTSACWSGTSKKTRTVRIVNRSQRSVSFKLQDEGGALGDHSVTWQPTGEQTLRPKGHLDVDLRFAPTYRIPIFHCPLVARCSHGEVVRLLQVSGTCHASDIRLSEHSINFGDVVAGSQSSWVVKLHNFGDLASNFRFEVPLKFQSFYSVAPSEGFVRPQDDAVLTVTFHPKSDRIRDLEGRQKRDKATDAAPGNVSIAVRDIRCILEHHEPVRLEVIGRCVSQPEDFSTLDFATEVRQKHQQSFPVSNTTSADWKLRPQVRTLEPPGVCYWSTAAEIVVPAGATDHPVEVVYQPLTMTGPDGDGCDSHHGSLFVGKPDGTACQFKLQGQASAPKVDRSIQVEAPCKKQHTQAVPVLNWLQERQRFRVDLELVKPAPEEDAHKAIHVDGVRSFDLPPGLQRDYRFRIYAYQKGAATVRLTFRVQDPHTNKDTGEYLTMEVDFTFMEAESLAVIQMEAACRQLARHTIAVTNPLSTPVTFTGSTNQPELRFSPNPLTVNPQGQAMLDLLFRPVEEGEMMAEATLNSDELGLYPYSVKLVGTGAGIERTLVLKAPLGGEVVETFKFLHYVKKPVTYEVTVESKEGSHKPPPTDFFVDDKDKNKSVQPAKDEGDEASVAVHFQPSSLQEQRAVLRLSGPGGGEYSVLLVGYSTPPQPQGPVIINGSGKSEVVEFRNPFDRTVKFTFQVDDPAFIIPKREERLDKKSSTQIPVTFQADKNQDGRLIVSDDQTSTPWIFYLKGLKN